MAFWIYKLFYWIILTSFLTTGYNFGGFGIVAYESRNGTYLPQPKLSRRVDNFGRQVHEDRPSERLQMRLGERSIPFTSESQNLEDHQGRKRTEPRVAEPITRIENGSFKVVNFKPIRRGQVADNTVMTRDAFVFPGPTTASKLFKPEVPDTCRQQGICESVPNYPQDLVDRLVNQLGESNKHLFQIDDLEPPEIAQRIGSADETELCEFREVVFVPESAPDVEGEWHFIVNNKQKPLQGFRVETCNQKGSPCSNLVHFRIGYTATCKQKYALRRMVSLDMNGKLSEKTFKIPSCCSCVIRNED